MARSTAAGKIQEEILMKKIFKRLLVILCLLCICAPLMACGKKTETIGYEERDLKNTAYQIVGMIASFNAESYNMLQTEYEPDQISEILASQGLNVDGEAVISAVGSFLDSKSELGDVSVESIKENDIMIEAGADEVKVTVKVTGNGKDTKGNPRTADIEMLFNERLKMTSAVTNINRSIGENMTNAALNTLLGMGTVFAVLILIALVINCFKYIGVIEKSLKEKKNAPKERAEAIDNALGQIIENESQNDPGELIAVISAAIAAYEAQSGGQNGGYVVRSIKRVR